MAPGLANGQGQGGGVRGFGLKDRIRMKGQGSGVGPWVKGGWEGLREGGQ